MRYTRFFVVFAFLFIPFLGEAQFYYGLYQNFGKNRVQYNEFKWTYYRYEQYDVFFYKHGKEIAKKASVMTDRNLKRMSQFLDHSLDQRIRVMVFNSLTDLKQSNLNPSDDDSYNTGGVTRTAGTRMFVYFNGDYADLERQIKQGIAHLMLSNMLYGGFTSSLKNSTLLNLPEWYTEGLISYLSTPWNPTIDEHVMDGFASNRYKRLNSLSGEEAHICGHSIWQYIADTYGDGVIKNMLFMTIVNRSVETAMVNVLGIDLKEFTNSWRSYYLAKYQNSISADNVEGKELFRSKKEEKLFHPVISSNGRYMAYASNDQGLFKVYVYDFVKKKRKRVIKRGFRIAQNNDYSYPLLAWNTNNRILAFITEEKGFIWLYFYDVSKGKLEKRNLFGFEKILSFNYSPDGKELLFSAVQRGKSDIFIYTILSSSIEQITNDDYTDFQPMFFNGNSKIVFSSNRPHDTIKQKEEAWRFSPNRDLFLYHRFKKDNKILWRLTNTPNENEVMPLQYEPGYIAFLSNPNITQERFLMGIDSSIAYVDTSTHYNYDFNRYKASRYTRSISDEDVSYQGERIVNLYYKDKRYRIFEIPYRFADEMNLISDDDKRIKETEANVNRKKIFNDFEITEGTKVQDFIENEVNIDDYQFDPSLVGTYSPRKKKKKRPTAATTPATAQATEKENYEFPPSRNYFLTFYATTSQLKLISSLTTRSIKCSPGGQTTTY